MLVSQRLLQTLAHLALVACLGLVLRDVGVGVEQEEGRGFSTVTNRSRDVCTNTVCYRFLNNRVFYPDVSESPAVD
jgi:hypothetical protein